MKNTASRISPSNPLIALNLLAAFALTQPPVQADSPPKIESVSVPARAVATDSHYEDFTSCLTTAFLNKSFGHKSIMIWADEKNPYGNYGVSMSFDHYSFKIASDPRASYLDIRETPEGLFVTEQALKNVRVARERIDECLLQNNR